MSKWVAEVEWNWVMTSTGDCLHHATSLQDPDEWESKRRSRGTTSCGRTSILWYPGLSSRMDRPRCKHCCRSTGFPQGVGSPKNDEVCRPLVFSVLESAT